MESNELKTRISQKLKSQGVEPDSDRIEAMINRLVNEFGVPPTEAERTILQDILKEHGKQMPKPAPPSSGDSAPIADLVPGEWVAIEGKVVSVADPPSPAVAQTGVIADSSGAVRFVIFAKNAPALLRKGAWYRLESAVVDEFRGQVNLKVHSGTTITPIDEDRTLEPVITRIADLSPGIASVQAKVVQNWDVRHERMQQTGLLGDESGVVKFIVWKGESDTLLEQDQVYTIRYGAVDEYNGRLTITVDPASCTRQDEADIEVVSRQGAEEEVCDRFEGKIISLEPSLSDAITESGVVATPEGAYAFTVWANAGIPPLEQGGWYAFEGVTKGIFRGAQRISLGEGAVVSPVEDRPLPPPGITPVAELAPGIASIRVKLVQEWESRSDRMLQTGLVGDESGIVKFVIWNGEGSEKLAENTVYTFFYSVIEEYNGRLSVNLTQATALPEEEAEMEVSRGGSVISGALVHIASGSGIVKRCPEEGCNRVLSRQNFCPIHEFKPDFRYDLRIRGTLDDGQSARNILLPREVVESLFSMTLAEAQDIAENQPLGADEVIRQLADRALGRYLSVTGRSFEDLYIANEAAWITVDHAKQTDLLNRAGGESA
ncbi:MULTISPECIES: hypothetical protein [Methanocalculus]|uniref:hypothetical protein n=1 Tax=Methanocalculus TaxID=71151 RepID=UPI00209DB45B|nr:MULTISPECIES: hypothetical protein [unclassified Methanocalculus]MCP1661565.1 replication factor A1 [Methanocalculus sp. AMF5]